MRSSRYKHVRGRGDDGRWCSCVTESQQEPSGEQRAASATGDPKLVEVLVANLIDNALRHHTTAGHMNVSTISGPGRATITVSNTGPAIPPSEIDRLFQPSSKPATSALAMAAGTDSASPSSPPSSKPTAPRSPPSPRPGGGLDVAVTFGSADGKPPNP